MKYADEFVHLTIDGEINSKFFTEMTGIEPSYTNGEQFDYHDIDLAEDLRTVIRALADMRPNSYQLIIEETSNTYTLK